MSSDYYQYVINLRKSIKNIQEGSEEGKEDIEIENNSQGYNNGKGEDNNNPNNTNNNKKVYSISYDDFFNNNTYVKVNMNCAG